MRDLICTQNLECDQAPQQRIADPLYWHLLDKSRQVDICFPGVKPDLLHHLIARVPWNNDFYIAFNRRFNVPRLQAWYGDEGIEYRYANNLLKRQDWLYPLDCLRKQIQQLVGQPFNAVLLTYYRDGNDSVGWHADDDIELGADPVIASLSLGATRCFQFRHRFTGEHGEIPLHNGELLIMQAGFQAQWEHCVPVAPEVNAPRINLTFRHVINR